MSLKMLFLGLVLVCVVLFAFIKKKTPEFLYKIVTHEEWKKAQEENLVPKGSIDTDFIHLSTEGQLERVLAKFWKGQKALVLKIETSQMQGDLRFETNPGGGTKFYHLYNGEIPTSSVKNIVEK